MANTIEIVLNDTTWTEVADSTAGFITNEGGAALRYRESDVLPDPSDLLGHTLELKSVAFVAFSLQVGQKVYCRSAQGYGKLALTLGAA